MNTDIKHCEFITNFNAPRILMGMQYLYVFFKHYNSALNQ